MNQDEKKIIGHKMRLIHNGIEKYFDGCRCDSEMWLPRGQGMMIHYLMDHREEEIYQKDLEAVFSISGATASNIIKGLEKQDLVVRIPNEKDARLKKIIPTQKAIDREVIIKKNLEAFEQALKKGMTEEEVTTFCELCDKLILNLEEMNSKDS